MESGHRLPLSLLDQRLCSSDLVLPNIIGVGAPRCGTTYLYYALAADPDVWAAPAKEINFFGIRGATLRPTQMSLGEYSFMFEEGRHHHYRMESSPVYLTHEPSLQHLCNMLNDFTVIVQLRDPMRRLWSHYKHHGWDDDSATFTSYVTEALDRLSTTTRRSTQWRDPAKVLTHSLYADGLEYLYAHLEAPRVLVLDYADLYRNPKDYVERAAAFLGLGTLPGETVHGHERVPGVRPPTLPRPVATDLARVFAEDQERVRELIGWSYDIGDA